MQFIIFDVVALIGILGHGAMLFTKIGLILYYAWAILDTLNSVLFDTL